MKIHLKLSILILPLLFSNRVEAQLTADSLLIEGHYRTFYFNKPKDKASSLLFVLHGSGGKAKNMRPAAMKLENNSEAESLILVYPQGYKTFWNECRKSATTISNLENINENAFFAKMIKYFVDHYEVNSKHVFAIGISGGGQMAFKLGLTMPDQFAGIAAIVANMPTPENMDCVELRKPIAVMIINGTDDPVNPYEGGEMKSLGLILGNVRSTKQTFQYWAEVDGYAGQPVKKILPDENVDDNISIVKYTFLEASKPEVVLFQVIHGKHEFPQGMNAFLEGWNFFKRQIK